MSAKCKFSLKYLPLANMMWMRVEGSKDAFRQWVNEQFDDASADEIVRLITGRGPGKGPSHGKPKSIVIPSLARAVIQSEDDSPTVDSLFVGRSDLRMQMEQRFAEDIVALSVFDLSANNGKGSWVNFDEIDRETGLSVGNKNIMNYKNKLIKDLCDEMKEPAPVLTANMSAQEYDGTIKEVLRKYRNYISGKETVTAYNSFAILQNFDELIKAKSPYILFNEDMSLDYAGKYQYKGPNVEHYTGFTSSESASIENQDSDLAKILLNVIPEINTEGEPIFGSFIGLSGFNSVMTSLKKALLYSPDVFDADKRATYYNGLGIDMNGLLDDYIKVLVDPKSKIPENHRNFLISKLRGIQKYIYQSGLDQDIKDMFTQMFFKTEPTSYRVYGFDEEYGEITGRNLGSTVSNNQKFALEDAIRGAVYFLRTTPSSKKDLKDSYNIKYENGQINISSDKEEFAIKIIRKNGIRFVPVGNPSDAFVKKVILDVLGIIVPDTYNSVGIQVDGYKFKLLDDFITPLGIVLSAVYTDGGTSWKGYNVVDLKNYSQALLTTAKKFGIIYGDETKNVVKSPSGNNLPNYQLTNMTYNTMSILDDIRKWSPTNAEHVNPYLDSLYIENRGLLVAPQIRNEIRVGDQIKRPDELSVKELLQVSILEDFYSPFVRDKIIYLQNATFADKSTHYLIGYDTTKTNFGLDEEIKEIIKSGSSQNLIETVRLYRKRRLDKIASNIVTNYKKAFLLNGKIVNPKYKYDDFDTNSLEGWDTFLRTATLNGKSITIDDVEQAFHDNGLIFKEEAHAYKPRVDSRGKVRINETLLAQWKSVQTQSAFKNRTDSARKQFIKSIEDNHLVWNKYDNPKLRKIWDDYHGKLPADWFDSNSGDMFLAKDDKLHPILEAYFVTNMLLSNEYNAVTIGEVWAHPNKNGNDTNEPVKWARYANNNYEVSSQGDSRFSALVASFKPGTIIDGVDVSNMTIEAVYQNVVKKSGKNRPPAKGSKLLLSSQAKGKMTFSYGSQKRRDVQALTTIDAIRNGERTATTRYQSDGHIEYWQNLKVGDIVEFTGANGESVLVKITTPLTKLSSNISAEEWSRKEGWSTEYFNTKVVPRLNEAYQIEYKYITDNTKEGLEEFSYQEGYLPLWQEWAKQNPELIEELRQEAKGKVLTDKFANTMVSQARALADILNSTSGEIGTYEEFSEASRLIAQIKRSVAFGATYHPFAQNKNNGVTSEIDIAIMEDMPAYVQTPNGVEGEVDSMDGSGISDALEARFENNSLIDARVGDNKKTIMMDVDKAFGTPILLKWAVYALTNEVRRNSYASVANGELLCKKMRSRYISTIGRVSEYYDDKATKITYEDVNTGQHFKILNVGLHLDGYYRTVIEVDSKTGKEIGQAFVQEQADFAPGVSMNTLYALDQLFGGAWTCKFENGVWNYTEENNDVLEEILSKPENQTLKRNAFIAYAVNKTAIKVGAGEVNKVSSWNDDSTLRTIKMSTKYGGVQMDADHELDLAQVTEMTQMISALIEDQHYSDLVKDIYEDIGNVVEAHMLKYNKNLYDSIDQRLSLNERNAAKKKLRHILGESLVVAFSSGSKDTLGLAQAFVAKAADAIQKQQDFKFPFSAATINGAFISQIASDINRGGIRHKYEGFAGVLNPSFNMIQYFRVKVGDHFENRMFPQLAELMRSYNNPNLTIESVTKNHGISVDALGNINITNPFVVETNVNDVDFEDTIIVVNNGVVEKPIYINSYDEYDKIKTRLRQDSSLRVFLWTSRGRNLRGADTRFTVNGIEYSYYDLDSVKACFYLNRYRKNKDSLTDDQRDFLTVYLGPNWFRRDINTLLLSERNKTQNTLKQIENGGEITSFIGLGLLNAKVTSWRTRAPEIITGRYQANKFGLTSNDHINNITSSDYFVTALNAKYNNAEKENVPDNLYDVILYSGDTKYYVKIGNTESEYAKVDGISSNPKFTENGSSIWYDNEEITTSEGKSFKTYTDETGKQFNLIAVDSIDRFNELLKSGIFERRIMDFNPTNQNLNTLMDITDIEAESIDDFSEKYQNKKQRVIEKKAERMFKSFKQSLLYVGARIPTQAMQSFMPMEVIAWVNSDKNVVYVPAMQTYLEGSDYDIDKLYIMAHSVDNNGFITTGSGIEHYFGTDVVTNIGKPNGIHYSEGDGTIVSYYELQQIIGNRDIDTVTASNILNRIYNSNTNKITFVDDGSEPIDPRQLIRDKNRFFKIINSHSEPDRDVKGNALKNRLVDAIYNLSGRPQNQLIAQIPVDMGEPSNAAKASTLGKAEMHINSDNPETIFMMQVQNMVGKKVIGISAVALKGFFAMSYVYSRKTEALKAAILNNEPSELIMKRIDDLLIENPLTGEVTSIANLDVESILDLLPSDFMININEIFVSEKFKKFAEQAMKVDPNIKVEQIVELDGSRTAVLDLYRLLDILRERVNRTDAALVISSIVSAATDNAKELILAKINATPELVDIYTTLTVIGVPFADIAKIMTSPTLQFITQLGENNIFDASTTKYKVKDAIAFYNDHALLKGVDTSVLIPFLTKNGNLGSRYMKLENILKFLQNDDALLKNIENVNLYIATYGEKTKTAEAALKAWQSDPMAETHENFDTLPFTIEQARNVVKFLELVHRRNVFRKNNPDNESIEQLEKILPAVEEFGEFCRMLGINQGLPTSLYEIRSRNKQLNSIMEHEVVLFDTASALNELPHFSKMLDTISTLMSLVSAFSVKSKTVLNLADAIEAEYAQESTTGGTHDLTEDEFKAISDYVGDLLIARFLRESDFEFWVGPDAYVIKSYTGSKSHPEQLRRIKLDSGLNLENFKNWMDSYVIPRLKQKYKGNAFIDALRPMADIKTRNRSQAVITGWRLPLQMMDIDKSPNTIQLYSEILTAFDEIANQEAGTYGQNIGDLFYVYNMLVNKDSYGQMSLTRLFEDLVQKDSNSMVNKYNEWLSDIDEDNNLSAGDENTDFYGTIEALGGSSFEARYRIAKYVEGSYIQNPLDASGDSILDLPVFYNIPIKSVTLNQKSTDVPQPAFKYTLDATAVVTEMVKHLQSRLKDGTIHLITDDELEDFKDLPQYDYISESKGFILNGEIYVNVSRCADVPSGVLLHEFAHVVFAAMKSNPDHQDIYYEMISRVKDHPAFEEIAKQYPNAVGSDLYEEVFVNLLEEYLGNKEYLPTDASDEEDTSFTLSGFFQDNESTFIDSISYLLGLDKGTIRTKSDIIGKSLEEIMDKFGFNLLNSNVEITKAVILDSQRQSTVKQDLYETEKLTMKCDE